MIIRHTNYFMEKIVSKIIRFYFHFFLNKMGIFRSYMRYCASNSDFVKIDRIWIGPIKPGMSGNFLEFHF